MPRMSESEVRRWKERLEFADRVWKEHGATGEGENNVFQYLESYRNHIWPEGGYAGFSKESLASVPLSFSVTKTMIAQFSARHPRPIVKPRGRTLAKTGAMMNAQVNEIVIDAFMRDLRMKQQVDDALQDSLLLHAGFVLHGYTPPEETFDGEGRQLEPFAPAVPDAPFIRPVPVWDMRIDPLASSWRPDGDAEWFAYRRLRTMEQVQRNPNLVKRRDLTATKSADARRLHERKMRGETNPEWNDLVEEWVVFDKRERRWFSLTPGSDKPLRDPEDWPLPWTSLPYDVLSYNRQPDDPFPIPFPKLYHSLDVLYNKLTAILYGTSLSTRRKILVQGDALVEGEIEKLGDAMEELSEYIDVKTDPRTILAEAKVGTVPQELLLLRQQVKEEIREILGQSQMDRAQRINVESASEAQFVQAGSITHRTIPQERVEEFWASILEKWHQGFQVTQTENVLIPVIGSERARDLVRATDGVLEVPPDRLKGEWLYAVKPGSTIAEEPEDEMRRLLAYKEAMADSDNLKRFEFEQELTRAFRMDPERMLNSPEEAEREQLQQLVRGATNGSGRSGGQGLSAGLVSALEPGKGS